MITFFCSVYPTRVCTERRFFLSASAVVLLNKSFILQVLYTLMIYKLESMT